jgi:hypothetical protein
MLHLKLPDSSPVTAVVEGRRLPTARRESIFRNPAGVMGANEPMGKVDLIPGERTQFRDAQPVPEGNQDHGGDTASVRPWVAWRKGYRTRMPRRTITAMAHMMS